MRVVIAHRIRAAERALVLHLADRMNGHQPDHVDAQLVEAVQAGGNSVQVAGRREIARKDFVDHGVRRARRAAPQGLAPALEEQDRAIRVPTTLSSWTPIVAPAYRQPDMSDLIYHTTGRHDHLIRSAL